MYRQGDVLPVEDGDVWRYLHRTFSSGYFAVTGIPGSPIPVDRIGIRGLQKKLQVAWGKNTGKSGNRMGSV
jgi:hypothetical protein